MFACVPVLCCDCDTHCCWLRVHAVCVLINFHNCIDGGKHAFEERKVRKGEQETCGNHIKHAVIVNVFPTSWMIRKGIDTAHQRYSHYKNN